MRSARLSRAARRSQRDAATWPAPATENAGSGQASPASPSCGVRCAVRPGHARGRDQCGRAPFSWAARTFPRPRGILRVRLSETRDRDARASRLGPNVTPARCRLLTRLATRLKAGGWAMRTPPGAGSYRPRPNPGKRFHIIAERDPLRLPLPSFGVRVRTVGDFFRGGQFIGKAAASVPGKTSNEIEGLLRAYPVMIHYA